LKSLKDLANALSYAVELIDEQLTHKAVHLFHLPKRRQWGPERFRTVVSPEPPLRGILQTLKFRFEDFVSENFAADYPGPGVHGYIRDRGIYSNAEVHCGRYAILRIDLNSYFKQ